ncbi:MAG: glycosyl hydrolase-related protein, partial [Victivallales bacterium]
GVHEFTYCLLPHKGHLTDSNVMAEGAMLNMGVTLFDDSGKPKYQVPCTIESDGISMEVLKKAEKENCIVIRLVETKGHTSSGILKVNSPKAKLVETNLLEWTEGKTISALKPLEIAMRPFEIRTYKIKM